MNLTHLSISKGLKMKEDKIIQTQEVNDDEGDIEFIHNEISILDEYYEGLSQFMKYTRVYIVKVRKWIRPYETD